MVIGVVALTVVTAGAMGVAAWQNHAESPETARSDTQSSIATVTRADLSNTQTLKGTLGYSRTTTLKGGKAGLITWLPSTGTTVKRGKPLYRVDNVPVPVFYGDTPLYRTLSARGTTGPDVKTVADNLRELGYDTGSQPPVGTWVTPQPVTADERDAGQGADAPPGGTGTTTDGPTDRAGAPTGGPDTGTGQGPSADDAPSTPAPVQVKSGDGVLTSSLIAAIKRWQTSAGMPSTGVLRVGDVSVLSGAVRISGVQAQLADPADGTLMAVTSTKKSVTVAVDPTQVGSMKRGDRVTVDLPDSSTAEGTIDAISANVQLSEGGAGDGSGGGPGEPQLNVSISLRDTAAVRALNSAPVDVRFTSETRKGVLTVPVGALLALSEGGYSVQLPDGELVAVKTGMFSKGMVEVSGEGIGEGTKVVTTS
ncbi:hypothetical protein [Streptomyces griseus]|uniref:hypothetical protein n=1 Tax=Streptomyces griseus TaxID=1911 RepID=UPI0008401501|nr:hypothetical protein [Streptomyces griseus]